MRWIAPCVLRSLLPVMLLPATGCAVVPRLLCFIGVKEKPVMVAFVLDSESNQPKDIRDWLDPTRSYQPMFKAMAADIGRPVGYDLCFPLQIAPNLQLGLSHLAVVSPVQYARLRDQAGFEVIAVAVDRRGRTARSGLPVVAAGSDIKSVEELRGKKVAFGPADDARTHQAALKLLVEHGIGKTDLALEVLPIPGSLRHLPHMRAVAQSVISGSYDAGFVDEAAWEEFPERDAGAGEPARDKLRVLAKTIPVPNRLVLCSSKLEPQAAAKVRSFLLGLGEHNPAALKMLALSGYAEPSQELLAVCPQLITPDEPSEK